MIANLVHTQLLVVVCNVSLDKDESFGDTSWQGNYAIFSSIFSGIKKYILLEVLV